MTVSKSKLYEVKISTDTCSSGTSLQAMDFQPVVTEAEGTVDTLKTPVLAASPVCVGYGFSKMA